VPASRKLCKMQDAPDARCARCADCKVRTGHSLKQAPDVRGSNHKKQNSPWNQRASMHPVPVLTETCMHRANSSAHHLNPEPNEKKSSKKTDKPACFCVITLTCQQQHPACRFRQPARVACTGQGISLTPPGNGLRVPAGGRPAAVGELDRGDDLLVPAGSSRMSSG